MGKIFKLQSELLESAIRSTSNDGDIITIDLEDVIKRREFLGMLQLNHLLTQLLTHSLTHLLVSKVQMLN